MTPPLTNSPPFDPLAQARARLGQREEEFVSAVAAEYWRLGGRRRRRARERVANRFGCSWYHLELLENHFKMRLDAMAVLRPGATAAAHTHPED